LGSSSEDGRKTKSPDSSRCERAEKRKRRQIDNEVTKKVDNEEVQEEIVDNSEVGHQPCTDGECRVDNCNCRKRKLLL